MDRLEKDRELRGVTSHETHSLWAEFIKGAGYTAEEYAILKERSKRALRDSFRRWVREH